MGEAAPALGKKRNLRTLWSEEKPLSTCLCFDSVFWVVMYFKLYQIYCIPVLFIIWCCCYHPANHRSVGCELRKLGAQWREDSIDQVSLFKELPVKQECRAIKLGVLLRHSHLHFENR